MVKTKIYCCCRRRKKYYNFRYQKIQRKRQIDSKVVEKHRVEKNTSLLFPNTNWKGLLCLLQSDSGKNRSHLLPVWTKRLQEGEGGKKSVLFSREKQ